MNSIYRVIGITKQGFHQWVERRMLCYEEQGQLLPVIKNIRKDHPMLSSRHIYNKIKPKTMGRDSFETFCFKNGFKLYKEKNRYKTTRSKGFLPFPNLLLESNEFTYINQLWVSDITYFDIGKNTYYLTFITDVFNREIIGFTASLTLRTQDTTLTALEIALDEREIKEKNKLIFHSDGGGQYYCKEFIKKTKKYGIKNSMGKTGYENPYAERINGIIKNYYLIPYNPKSFKELQDMLFKAVYLYNTDRPHRSLNGYSPKEFLKRIDNGLLKKKWKINIKDKRSKNKKVIFIT